MVNQYQNGKEVFKLYGLKEETLARACEQVSKISGEKVKMTFTLENEDACVVIEKAGADDKLFDETLKSVIKTFSSFIYANREVSLAQNAVDLLKVSGRKLCVAESFTGGAVANSIVQIPGASEVFYEGIVCYDTNSKIRRLGVNPLTVKAHTVVSREVALEMVQGLLEDGNCDIAIATTGYASPTGDPSRPAGLCYIAVANEQKAEIIRCNFSGTREQIIESGKRTALFSLNRILRG